MKNRTHMKTTVRRTRYGWTIVTQTLVGTDRETTVKEIEAKDKREATLRFLDDKPDIAALAEHLTR